MKLPGNLHRIVSRIAFTCLLAFAWFNAPQAAAQSAETKEKIRLMSAALRARDAGDLNIAKENLEDLLRLNPDDRNVQNLLAAVNKDIDRQSAGQRTIFGRAATVTDFDPNTASTPPASAPVYSPAPETAPGTFVETQTVTYADGQPQPLYFVDGQPVYSDPDYDAGAAVVASTDSVTYGAIAPNLDALLAAEASNQKAEIEQAEAMLSDAKKLIQVGRYKEADDLLVEANESLELNTATVFVKEEIQAARGSIYVVQGKKALAENDIPQAEMFAAEYEANLGSDEQLTAYKKEIVSVINDPWRQDPEELSPQYVANQEAVEKLLVKGRAQMLYGDIDGAVQTFREVEARDPTNAEAKSLQVKAMQLLQTTSSLDHSKTRSEMLQEVSRSWQRPQIFDRDAEPADITADDPLLVKIASIEIPSVRFSGVPLSRVVETLSELSVEYDVMEEDPKNKGVNMVLIAPPGQDPPVSITLRNLTLDKILDFTVETVGFQWDVRNEAVLVSKGSDQALTLETEFFSISSGVVIRLTGVDEGGGGGGAAADPFAPAPTGGGAPTASDTEESLKSFFQRAGVDFENEPGASLAFDGTLLIVTQTPRNLEKMRNILRRYDQPKQVEIEAKFMEVNQGSLDELGFSWDIQSGSVTTGFDSSGNPVTQPKTTFQTDNRSLSQAFAINRAGTLPLSVTSGSTNLIPPTDLAAPDIPNAIDLGTAAGNIFTTFGIINGVDVNLIINALSREEGSDLLSSPRLTVLSGRPARIVVAQELRYPESYGDIESNVGTGGAADTGAAGVTITAGTPQDFTTRNVGVEMEVTPTVEENENISLKLEPRVTEFEGFVEYGGPSIAISGNTTVTVPSGFFQPIFSTRTVRTEVTVYDGATVVIGGLTREEIVTVNDKVPVLGDIPLIGRLFQNKGESSQKRNLLIFVTANLISPGGSPSKQRLKNIEPNALFQNPTIVTPGGGISREIEETQE